MNKPVTRDATSAREQLFNPDHFAEGYQQAPLPVTFIREHLTATLEKLNNRYEQAENIENIINDYSWYIDQLLIFLWQQFDWVGDDNIALLAVGGYGRSELHPYSDIDIQILMARDKKNDYKANIEKFLTLLWDINLEIGQSVRTIKENKVEATRDITIATALMESRTITGNPVLHEKVITELSRKRVWDPKKFFAAKVEEQQLRHQRHDDIEYALEPNLKLAPGGLRDIQTIGWISKRYFGASDFKELVERGFLEEHEYQDLINGRNFLWSLRYGLHMVSGRREDRLLFDLQRQLADIFGFKDDKKSRAIEKLMQRYYRVVLTLRELNDVLLQIFDEEIIRSKEKSKIREINKRFQIHNNYIEAVRDNVFKRYPSALIEIFVLLAQNDKIEGIRASTIRLIRQNVHLIDDKFRKDIRNTTLFMELLRSPHKVVRRLRQMKRYGILSAYLPEFGRIVGQMQHDLFHIYTVDDHTLQVVENMRRFRHEEARERFPLAAQVMRQIPKPELLYIAGLYHDIAKGRGGDHSELGVKDAHRFCRRHSLGKWDTALVGWLVQHHLKMSSVAQREDIQDPETINNFARLMGDQTHLDYLYALTVADINATNPKLWNTWRASLLRKLYTLTKRSLTHDMEHTLNKQMLIQQTQDKAIEELKQKGLTKKAILNLWNNPSEDYFQRESAEDIVWHTLAISRQKDPDSSLVIIKNNTEQRYEGATQVFIVATNERFLFANMANAFDRLRLNIQDARIYYTDANRCMLSFMILEADGNPLGKNPQRLAELKNMLTQYAQATEQKSLGRKVHTTRKMQHFTRSTQATINNNPDVPFSILEVLCPDRPGILAIIANLLVELDIIIHNAKITTLGENVEDVFFLSDADNNPITDPALIEKIQNMIKSRLDEASGLHETQEINI